MKKMAQLPFALVLLLSLQLTSEANAQNDDNSVFFSFNFENDELSLRAEYSTDGKNAYPPDISCGIEIRPINYFQNALGNSELDISLGDSNDFSQLISVPIDDKTDQLLEHVFLGSKIHNDDTMRGYKCVSKDNKSPHYACAICVDQTPCNGYAFRGPASCPTLEFGDSDLDENDLAVFTTRERINLSGLYLKIKDQGLDSCNSIVVHHSTRGQIELARIIRLEDESHLLCVFPFQKPESLLIDQDITVKSDDKAVSVSAGYAWGNTNELGPVLVSLYANQMDKLTFQSVDSPQVVLDIIRSYQEEVKQTLNLKIRGSFPKDMAMIQFQIEFLDDGFKPVDIWNGSANAKSLMPVQFPLKKSEQQSSLKAITDNSGAVNAIFVTLYGGSDSDNLLQPYYDDVTGGLILLEIQLDKSEITDSHKTMVSNIQALSCAHSCKELNPLVALNPVLEVYSPPKEGSCNKQIKNLKNRIDMCDSSLTFDINATATCREAIHILEDKECLCGRGKLPDKIAEILPFIRNVTSQEFSSESYFDQSDFLKWLPYLGMSLIECQSLEDSQSGTPMTIFLVLTAMSLLTLIGQHIPVVILLCNWSLTGATISYLYQTSTSVYTGNGEAARQLISPRNSSSNSMSRLIYPKNEND